MNLDKLLADALKHAHNLKHAGAKLHQSLECALIHREVQHRYGPQSWRAARAIELIWSDTPLSPCYQSLGIFRELLHDKSNGRRLAKMDHAPESEEIHIEFVYGEHWISPARPVERTTSVHEVLELRERFEELMREVELEALSQGLSQD